MRKRIEEAFGWIKTSAGFRKTRHRGTDREPCAIYRSTDDGLTWSKLPVEVSFPAVSMHPDIPK